MRNRKIIVKTAQIEELDLNQVRRLIGEERYQEIKAGDSHPFFVELLVAHEGISQGKIVGAGLNRPVKKLWEKARVDELVKRLKESPVPIYLFHSADSISRKEVGKILTAYARKVAGRWSALALAYISDPAVRQMIREKELDTCSLEAELIFEQSDEKKGLVEWVVRAIERVSGLALGSRRLSKPGFAGASILATAEEFEDDLRVRDYELALKEKEDEIRRLQKELAQYQKEQELKEQRKKVVEVVEGYLKDKSLKEEEKRLILESVAEKLELKRPEKEKLSELAIKETDKELEKLSQLRRLYQSPIPSPLEVEDEIPQNPLIPRD